MSPSFYSCCFVSKLVTQMCLGFRNNSVTHKKLDGRNELKEMNRRDI